MPIYHVRFICAADYMARRLPFRPAHLKQLATLREERRVVAGGPEPDGTAAHIFYRVRDHAELSRLLKDNEFNRVGLFAAHHARAFTEFFQPVDLPPVDAGLRVCLVEGAVGDHALARTALAAGQQSGRVAFGGFFEDAAALVAVRLPEPHEAVAWLRGAGGWHGEGLRARSWSQTL